MAVFNQVAYMLKHKRVYVMLAFTIMLSFVGARSFSQDSMANFDKILNFPGKLFDAVERKTARVESRLIKQSEKYFRRLARQEKKLQLQIQGLDSGAAKIIFSGPANKYEELQAKLKNEPADVSGANNYTGHIDSMQTALAFLNQNKLISQSANTQQKLQTALKQYQLLQGRLNDAQVIKNYLKERQQFLKQQIEKFGLTKQYRRLQQQIYYYHNQVEEIKNDLRTGSGIEKRILEIANKIPAFQNFFRKHSALAGMFRLPGSEPLSGIEVQGLQTRQLITQNLEQRFGSGAGMRQQLNQSITNAQSQLDQIRNRINQSGGSGEDLDMPERFKPNQEKVKKIRQRIETGIDIQSKRNNSLLPAMTDIALSAGYMLNSKSVAGISIAYRMAWGKDIRHITITHSGVGFRSFIDWKIPVPKGGGGGSLWVTGGAELNYYNEFKDLDILKNFDPWQKAALLGLRKKYSIGKKWKGNISLLYDLLAKPGIESPLKFRTGYNF